MQDMQLLRLALALMGLLGFLALLLTAVHLARQGQPVWASLTGGGALVVGIAGLYKLLSLLGVSA